MIYLFAAVTLLCIIALIYDALRCSAQDWLTENVGIMPRSYPWYVRLDYWLYHREACRVGMVLHDRSFWFGRRLSKVGAALTFIKEQA